MKKLNCPLLFVAIFLNVFAQDTFNGTVTDEAGNAVTGATVQIKGTFTGSITDKHGKFLLKSKDDSATLVISHLSFETVEIKTAAGSKDMMIILKPKSFLADEVIVRTTRATSANCTVTFDTVSDGAISKQNLAQDIPYLLDQIPSIVTTSDAGAGVGYTYLRIRGSNQSRINVTINGIPYNDPESQEVYWVDLPDFASSVDNIRIQRGVGTSTNGAGAFAGTINVQTTTLQREPYGELSGSYGSFNTWKATAKFGTGLIKNKFTFDGRLSQIKSDGYIDRAASDLKSFFLSGGYYGSKTIFRVNVFSGWEETYQAWWGVAGGYLDTARTHNHYDYPDEVDRYRQDHYQFIFSREAGQAWTINSALHYTRGKGYYEQYKGPEYNNDDGFNSKQSFSDYGLNDVITDNDTITETSLVRRRWLDNHFYGLTFSALYEKNKIGLTLGGAASRYNGNHFGEIAWMEFAGNTPKDYRYYDNDGTKSDINVYAKAGYEINNLRFFIDLQYRFASHEIAGTDNERRFLSIVEHHHFFNPKAGLSYDFNSSNEINASFGIANREPARSDYTDAPNNKLPEPERLRDLEVGYRFIKPKNLLNVNYYFMHYKDQLVLTGELNDVGSAIKTNVDKSYRTGIEVMNSLKPMGKFRWDVNLAYSMNKIKDFMEVVYVHDADDYDNIADTVFTLFSNTDISYSPFLVAGSALSYLPASQLELAFIAKYVSKQYLDNTGNDTRRLNGYFLGSFRINYSLKGKFFEEVLFTLLLNNIFNTRYESNGSVSSEMYRDETGTISPRYDYIYYFPQARFNVMGGVTIRFF